MADATTGPDRPPYDLITAFQPIGSVTGGDSALVPSLGTAIPLAARGTPVVLAGWGPPERCATDAVLRIAVSSPTGCGKAPGARRAATTWRMSPHEPG